MKEISDLYWTLMFAVLTTTYGITVSFVNTKLVKRAISTDMSNSNMKDEYLVAMTVNTKLHLIFLS